MARFRTRSARRMKRPVFWDSFLAIQSTLPGGITIASTNQVDGTQTGLRRYIGSTDRTIKRTIADFLVTVDQDGFQTSTDSVLELCVGIGIMDTPGDVDGQAGNTTIADGAGPLDDADNSRWMVRCCVQIPIGRASILGSTENISWKPTADSFVNFSGASEGGAQWDWGCHIDTKSQRRLRGLETQWITVALQASVDPIPTAGDDVNINMNALSCRWVLQNSA